MAPAGPRKAVCIFRRPLSCQRRWRKLKIIINLLTVRDPPAKMAWLLKSGIICLAPWSMLLKFRLMFSSKELVSGVFIVQGNAVPEMITFLAIFFEDGKLLWSLLSLVLGLIMRNCEDY